MIMVAAISSVLPETKASPSRQRRNNQNPGDSRPPLLPSERENGVHHHRQPQMRPRPRAREVPSRYMSSMSPSSSNSFSSSTTTTTTTNTTSSTSSSSTSSSRRFPSPLVSSRSNVSSSSSVGGGGGGGISRSTSTPKRAQSVDRRRSVTPKPAPVANVGEMSAATKLLVTSTRSLSVSFQGGTFSLPISKTKAVNQGAVSVRKATPERRRSTPLRGKVDGGGVGGGVGGDEVERSNSNSNSKPGDQLRWPARSRQFNMFSKSVEHSNNDSKEYLGSSVVARALHDSLLDESRRVSFDGILNMDSGNNDVLNGVRGSLDTNSVNESSVPSDLTASDSESVSSGSSGARDSNGGSHGRSGPRGISGSARFWQETNMRLRRLQDPGLGLSSSPSSKFVAPPKLGQSRKFSDGPPTSPRSMSSPIRGAVRAASPCKLMSSSASSPMRGLSPSRVRTSIGGAVCGSPWDAPSVLSFAVDVRRGKVGENRIVDVHQLRLFYNRHLQWRFVNARTDAALSVQRRNAEDQTREFGEAINGSALLGEWEVHTHNFCSRKNLWNAWITITALRDSVRHKRTQVQLLRQKLKLTSILRGQIAYLEEWSLLDEDHSSSLQGAIESLKASTLRLPVVGGATADVQSVKDAVSSAVDVMQSMASSTCSLVTKVQEVNSLMIELSSVAAKERLSLEKCKEVLSILAAKQVKDCSLRTHILQLNRSPLV